MPKVKVRKKVTKKADNTDIALLVTPLSNDELQEWDINKIIDSLETELGLDIKESNAIAKSIEEKLINSTIKTISTSLVRELIDNELFERGLTAKLKKHQSLGIPLQNLKDIIFTKNEENSNILSNNPEAVNLAIAENILKQFALENIFSQDVATAHLEGKIHIHDLGFPTRVYSFHKDECMLIKNSNIICIRSFKQLWDEQTVSPIINNDCEIKILENVFVYDKNKTWTRLKKIIRHKSNRKMLSIESHNGNSVIITDNHPFIVLEDKIPKYTCPECGKLTSITNGSSCKNSKTYICQKCNRQFSKKIKKYDLTNTKTIQTNRVTLDNWIVESDLVDRNYIKNNKMYFPIDKETAYFIGLFIAEGNIEKHSITITGKSHIKYVKMFAKKHNFSYTINNMSVRVYGKNLVSFLNFIDVGIKSDTKSLPKNFLAFDESVVDTIISGIFDGDGSIKKQDRGADELSIRVTSRILLSQLKYWFSYKYIKHSLTYIGINSPRKHKGIDIINKKPMYRIAFYLNKKNKDLLKNSLKFKSYKPIISKTIIPKVGRDYKNEKIKAIKECKYKDNYVYDITTESNTFVCNGILVHNCSAHSIEYIKKYGLSLCNLDTESAPAKHAQTLTGHLNTFLASMQSYYAGALGLGYVNIFYAPYLEGMSYEELKQEAQYLIFSCSQNAFSRGSQSLISEETVWIKKQNTIYQSKIGDLVDSKLKEDNQVQQENNIEISKQNKDNLEVVSFDKKGKISYKPITAFAKMPFQGKIYSFETSKGIIKGVTGDHSVLIWNGKSFVSQKASELKKNDYIVAPLKLPEIKAIDELNLGKIFAEKESFGGEIRVLDKKELFKNAIKRKFGRNFLVEIAKEAGSNASSIRTNWFRKKKIPIKIYDKYVGLDESVNLIYKGDSHSVFSSKIKVSSEFVKLLGYYISEGHNSKKAKTFIAISNTDDKFIDDIKQCLKFFNYSFVVHQNKNVKQVVIQGILGKIISFLGEDDLGVKQIPLFIYSLPKKLQLEFIKAFWRGDGIPCRKTLALSNTSENVINGMSLLFALNNKDFHLFKTTHKNSNWKDCYELRESLEDDRIIDHKNLEFRKKYKNLIKDMQEYEGVAPDELFLLLNADVGFARIRKINIYNYNGHVYDLSVKNNENFLGGTGLLFFHNSLFIDFNIHTGIPKYLRKIKVIGSGGKYLTKTYDKYKKLAVKFAMAMLDVWETGDKNGVPFVFPKCQLHINEETFTDKDQLALLKRATEVASKNGGVYFVFDREEVTLSQCCRLSTTITDKSMLEHPESQRFCGFQNITINLPQVAYRVGKGNIEEAIKDIKNLMDLAVKAHLQKKRFIARLMNKPNLPLWEIGKEAKDGNPYVDLEKATYIIGVIGLNECLQYLTGKELHEDEEVFKIGIKIITAMNMYCKELTKTQKLLFKLEESPAESASRRFVMIDLASYPKESKSVIRGDLSKDEAYYTNSIHLRADAPVDIITRIEKQSKFHTLIESGAIIHAFVGEKLPPAESILNLITKTWKNTACSQLTISPEFTICNDCKKLTMGIKDKCSICNSTNVEGMTRIVGYYSRVKNWNKSKLGELKDRQKGDYGV